MGSRGSGGHSRAGVAKTEPRLPDRFADISPPADITPAAVVYWDYYAAAIVKCERWTESARDTLRSYAEGLAIRDRLQERLNASDVLLEVHTVDGAGIEHVTYKANPLLNQIRACNLALRQYANDLCLSPAAAIRTPAVPAAEGGPTKWQLLTARRKGA